MRFILRPSLFLAVAAVCAVPAHASPREPVCATPLGGLLNVGPHGRFAQTDTPPASPNGRREIDPCTGRPVGDPDDDDAPAPRRTARTTGRRVVKEPRPAPALLGTLAQPGAPPPAVAQAPLAPGQPAASGTAGAPPPAIAMAPGAPSQPAASSTAASAPPPAVATAPGAPTQPTASSTAAATPAYEAPRFSPADTVVDERAAERNRRLLRLQTLALRDAVRPGPAGSVSVPTAYGVEWGEAFVGAALQARTRYTSDADAGLVAGAGIGSRRVAALEAWVASYSTVRGGGPGETGGLGLKLHRAFPGETGVAVGYENVVTWGGSDADPAPFAVASKVFRRTREPGTRFDAGVLTLGIGGGRFRSEDDMRRRRETVNVFGAVGIRVSDPLSIAADWTGQDLNAGISVTPIRRFPLVVTPGVADLLGVAGDGPRFIMSVGYGVGFRSLFP